MIRCFRCIIFMRLNMKYLGGQKLEVLLEEEIQVNGREYYLGHSKEYVKVAVEKSKGYDINDIITLQAEDFLDQHMLLGKF